MWNIRFPAYYSHELMLMTRNGEDIQRINAFCLNDIYSPRGHEFQMYVEASLLNELMQLVCLLDFREEIRIFVQIALSFAVFIKI